MLKQHPLFVNLNTDTFFKLQAFTRLATTGVLGLSLLLPQLSVSAFAGSRSLVKRAKPEATQHQNQPKPQAYVIQHIDAIENTPMPTMPLKSVQNLPAVLNFTWEGYKRRYIQADGRVVDPFFANLTTSEGQSYALLRAAWMRDKKTFDTVYHWTQRNLQVRGDHLFSWKWGKNKVGQWTSLEHASASDADQDIALALLMAHQLWGQHHASARIGGAPPNSHHVLKRSTDNTTSKNIKTLKRPGEALNKQSLPTVQTDVTHPQKPESYRQEALNILNDLWEKSTAKTPMGRVLKPGDWPQSNDKLLINPSYFAPYAYRIFAEADPNPAHHWNELVDSSYKILHLAASKTRTGLIPNWLEVKLASSTHKNTAAPIQLFYDTQDSRGDFGYDAIRAYWRVGLDYLLFPDHPASLKFLQRSNFLQQYWKTRQDMPSPMTADGILRNPKNDDPSIAIYGTPLIMFAATQPPKQRNQQAQPTPSISESVIATHIFPRLQTTGVWKTEKDYYGQNWLWFGLAGYDYFKRHQHNGRIFHPLQPETASNSRLSRLLNVVQKTNRRFK